MGLEIKRQLQIGGYFGLDVQGGRHFHTTEQRYNTARSALVAFCQAVVVASGRQLSILLPRFNCPDVVEALEGLPEIEVIPYSINENLEPILPDPGAAGSALYFVNLFGLKSAYAARVPMGSIVDNVHAFFSAPVENAHTIYSARKFFGVPDGAYLYSNVRPPVPPPYVAWENSVYLLQRIDVGARAGYQRFSESERALSGSDIRGMSLLSQSLLGSMDYAKFAKKRRANFEYLHDRLGTSNEMRALIDQALAESSFVPLCYPHLSGNGAHLREFLISEGIFIPRYWESIGADPLATPFERHLAMNALHLPIDQRYGRSEMDAIVSRVDAAAPSKN